MKSASRRWPRPRAGWCRITRWRCTASAPTARRRVDPLRRCAPSPKGDAPGGPAKPVPRVRWRRGRASFHGLGRKWVTALRHWGLRLDAFAPGIGHTRDPRIPGQCLVGRGTLTRRNLNQNRP
ncbi:MAG: hypothetical protein EON50_06150 [Acidovorax sp.]|nr:MAG: hypothetical protein EON50_06150 [Acidovorax sp.]